MRHTRFNTHFDNAIKNFAPSLPVQHETNRQKPFFY